jgi:hypothetical protein
MESPGGYLRGLVILSVFFALLLGASVATNAPVSVGTDITKIIGVNYLGVDQLVEIANEGTGSMNLTGWTLMNLENQSYSFPANFSLKAGTMVRVHAGKGNNTAADLFNSTLLWNKEGDTAALKEATGKIVSEYTYPIKLSAPGSVAKIEPLVLANTSSIRGTLQPFLPDYRRSDYGAERGNLKSSSPVNLTGHSFICHGGPLNWAWTSGL